MQKKALLLLEFFFIIGTLSAQKDGSYRIPLDDSTLTLGPQSDVTLMPFNRLVRSAGKVVTFGDSRLENHALDFSVLPDGKHIAVEDRYGVAVLDVASERIVSRWMLRDLPAVKGLMSTYSGIKSFVHDGHTYLVWSAGSSRQSALVFAEWDGAGLKNETSMPLEAVAPAATALPNDIAVQVEAGIPYLYVVLNGNNQLLKIRFTDRQVIWTAPTGVAPYGLRLVDNKVYVTNWAGPAVTDSSLENAGTPWGSAYTNPVTGATARGSLSVIDAQSGVLLKELTLGLHPNALVCSPDSAYLYVCNGNSDQVSVIDVRGGAVVDSIPVGLFTGSIT